MKVNAHWNRGQRVGHEAIYSRCLCGEMALFSSYSAEQRRQCERSAHHCCLQLHRGTHRDGNDGGGRSASADQNRRNASVKGTKSSTNT